MILNKLKPRKSLNKAFLKVKPNRADIEVFKTNLTLLIDQTNDSESEEFHKNLVSDFLKKTYYDPNHSINTKGRNDLVIHNGKDAKSTVGVIIEAKKPTNKAEMVSIDNLNKKAFQELMLYYLRERVTQKNIEIKYLIATNINEWFVFDATTFDRLFAQNKKLVKQFEDFEAGRLADIKTDFFYHEVAEPFINQLEQTIDFTHFDLREYEKPLRNEDKKDDRKLISLFKLLSPEHLLKLPFANDSNSLDKKFYSELLHIIGLTETKEGGKKVIQRNKVGERNSGSLLENAVIQLDTLDKIHRLEKPSQYGETLEERLFNVSLDLSITWVNRILFLKLLEAQLIAYHKGENSQSYAFLNFGKIKNYDDLNSLFFQVLAKKHDERNEDVKVDFANVPYLNSSLFEPNELEHNTILISNLRDEKKLPILSSTVLKDKSGKKRSGELNALAYIFAFLDAYDFSSEGAEDIQEDNKTLINASVLGLIFEKINGYKDGSFFTPGFITMYMCRETIRRSVVQKFNDIKNWECKELDDVYDKIEDRKEANEIVNSIKICDPAVGSGHFLVSALNEVISIKNDLKILQDRDGKRLKEYHFEVENDELVVTDEDGKLFEYIPTSKEAQRVQETLFHEKQTIIENCLFGVDINPNSVKICRLRLWIELLKNAYYKNETELETLPNIDINIKCGNSLISRFDLDADIKDALKKSKWTIDSYRIAVDAYRNAQSKEEKHEMERLINDIKSDFRTEITKGDPKLKKLYKISGELANLTTQTSLFDMSAKDKKAWNSKVEKLSKDSKKLETEIEEIKNNKIYENAFEWRFEFPEVLNDEGDFVGFDTVIGNPPYIRQEGITEFKPYLKGNYRVFDGRSDIYVYFYELANKILKPHGTLCFITPNKFFRAKYGCETRIFISQQMNVMKIIDFGELPVFDEASTFPMIFLSTKQLNQVNEIEYAQVKELDKLKENIYNGLKEYISILDKGSLNGSEWNLASSSTIYLINKLNKNSQKISDFEDLNLYSGIKTGFNSAFWIDDETKKAIIQNDPQSKDLIKPLCRGTDIRKWHLSNSNLNIIYTHNQIEIEDYPGIENYLSQFKEKLMNRAVRQPWWQLQQPQNKMGVWDVPKILYPDICKESRFTIDFNNVYSDMKGFAMTTNSLSILGILNSKLIWWFLKQICAVLGDPDNGGRLQLKSQYVNRIPIKKDGYISVKLESKVTQILHLKKENPEANTSELEAEIDQLVYELYDLTTEEIKLIEESVK